MQEISLIDTHCHLDFDIFSDQFSLVVERARAVGVQAFVLPGVVRAGWERLLAICEDEEGFYCAPGLHPMYLEHHQSISSHLDELVTIADQKKIVAIGEIGLDYYKKHLDRTAQQSLFEAQIDIAKTKNLPLILHVRKAHDQVLATIRRKHFTHGGIVHAFGGSFQQACAYVKLGFHIGIGGAITYNRATKIRRIAKDLASDTLVLETDAPDIAVASHSNEISLPEYLPEILATLAEIRGETVAETAACTTENAKRVLRLHQ